MAAAAAAAQNLLTECLKTVKPPLEGIPTPEDPSRKPLAEWIWHSEAFYRARGLHNVLTMDEDANNEPIEDFDWDALTELQRKQDDTVFLLLTSALSYSTGQAVRGIRHSAPLWRKLNQARGCVLSGVMHLNVCGELDIK